MNILVDIDNTLWGFASVLYRRLSSRNSNVPEPERWDSWFFWKKYMNEEEFYHAIYETHGDQMRYKAFPEAERFLHNLKKEGHTIIIASHRPPEVAEVTKEWLRKNSLSFDMVHLSYDKTVLFDTVDFVIDDAPPTINKACLEGIPVAALRRPWNCMLNIPLYNNLFEIKLYQQ